MSLFFTASALLASVPCKAQGAAATQEQKDEARARFDRGIALFNDGDNAGALAEFSRAYELIANPTILFNICLVHAAMNHPVQAVESLDRLVAAPGSLSAERLARARTLRDEQALRIATLNLVGAPPGAVIEIDNVRVATSPLTVPIRVASGTRIVGVIAPGFAPFRKEVTVAGGIKLDVQVELTPLQQSLAHLVVRTSLPGADVLVDGQKVGKTPLAASLSVAPGSRKVEVSRPGYLPARSDISLGEGATGEVALEPQEDPSQIAAEGGTLAIQASETDIVVSIDGRQRPEHLQGLQLPWGPHILKVERGGFLASQRIVIVDKARATTVRVQLVPTPDTAAKYAASIRSRSTWGWATTIAGGVIAGAGAGWLVYNTGKISDAQSARDAYELDAVKGSKRACDDTIQVDNTACTLRDYETSHDLSTARRNQLFGYVGLGVGVAAATTGVILLLTGDDPHRYERKSGESIALRPRGMPVFWAAPSGGGLGFVGAF